MTTSVVINDFEKGTRVVSMIEVEDFAIVKSVWNDEDRILVDMQEYDLFKGRTKWCDLDPTHFRLMIMRNLTLAADLTEEERQSTHVVIQSLHFLIGALIYCIQSRSESVVELMRIHRYGPAQVNYDYSAISNVHLNIPSPKKDGEFKVVVDND